MAARLNPAQCQALSSRRRWIYFFLLLTAALSFIRNFHLSTISFFGLAAGASIPPAACPGAGDDGDETHRIATFCQVLPDQIAEAQTLVQLANENQAGAAGGTREVEVAEGSGMAGLGAAVEARGRSLKNGGQARSHGAVRHSWG